LLVIFASGANWHHRKIQNNKIIDLQFIRLFVGYFHLDHVQWNCPCWYHAHGRHHFRIQQAMNRDQFSHFVRTLCTLPAETAWVEFKRDNTNPEMIGKTVAALSNAATLNGRDRAWMIWGIEDQSHDIVGTTFIPSVAKKGNQNLLSWLIQMLAPRLNLLFHEDSVDGKRVVVLEVPAAGHQPTMFSGKAWCRVGSATHDFRAYPEIERDLWKCFDATPFEKRIALSDCSKEEVMELLDFRSYRTLLDFPASGSDVSLLDSFRAEGFLRRSGTRFWDITNLGAILFAKDLLKFPTVSRKGLRLIFYTGKGRVTATHEREGRKGYATGFGGCMDYLSSQLPQNEVIGPAYRKDVPVYPLLALRELVANTLIHQDFGMSGTGPMVEIFSNRIEVSNPGVPLGDIDRLLDQPPISRNEALAKFMRRIGICEERGGGVDKVVLETERAQLPPPKWLTNGNTAIAILFARKQFSDMDKAERIRACYLHACLKWVMSEDMTNATLRERFGLNGKNTAAVSRIIREALDAGMIKPADPSQGKRNARYTPAWS